MPVRADDGGVSLPGVAIVPTAENMPHVSKFEVEIAGSVALVAIANAWSDATE